SGGLASTDSGAGDPNTSCRTRATDSGSSAVSSKAKRTESTRRRRTSAMPQASVAAHGMSSGRQAAQNPATNGVKRPATSAQVASAVTNGVSIPATAQAPSGTEVASSASGENRQSLWPQRPIAAPIAAAVTNHTNRPPILAALSAASGPSPANGASSSGNPSGVTASEIGSPALKR